MKLGSLVVVGEVESVKENGSYFIVKCVFIEHIIFLYYAPSGGGRIYGEGGRK